MPVRYKVSGREVRFCCPFCEKINKPPDTKFHLYVSMDTGDWICFRCGARGRNFKGLPEDFAFIVTHEALQRGILPFSIQDTSQEDIYASLPSDLIEIHDSLAIHTKAGEYILTRLLLHLNIGNRDDLLSKIPQGYVYVSPDLSSNSVFFMSRNRFGEVDYFVERIISAKDIKYKYPPNTKRPLMKVGVWETHVPLKNLFVVEGIVDALVVNMKYNTPVVALGGKTLSKQHISELNNLLSDDAYVFVFLDQDAQKEACKVCKQIYTQTYVNKVFRLVPVRKDPADSGGYAQKIQDFDYDLFCLDINKLHKKTYQGK